MIRSAFVLASLSTSLFLGLASGQAVAAGPCDVIVKACTDAGLLHEDSTRKQKRSDCLAPVMKGKVDLTTMPGLDQATIDQCRANQRAGAGTVQATGTKQVDVAGPFEAQNPVAPLPVPTGRPLPPNIVLVLVDDFSLNLMSKEQDILGRSMPNLAQMMKEGVTFSHFYVTDSLCCPSRTSIFTGLLPHNSGVFTNSPPNGGYTAFMAHGDDAKSFVMTLHDAGYQTAMMGKYLNGYKPNVDDVPRGWSEWAVAGNGYPNFNYTLNHNGDLITSPLHLTDELSQLGQDFLKQAAAGPFFLEVATFTPHAPFVPPARYAHAFADLSYPKTPAYAARPDENAPDWLARIPPLNDALQTRMAEEFRNRVRSDKGVDDMIGDLRKTLSDLGLTDRTYVIFTSDNGFHMGEYSMKRGKMTPFDTDINVPLVVVGPGIPANVTLDAPVMNTDLAPTFAEWAGAPPDPQMDGHALNALLTGKPAGPWRTMALVEHKHDDGKAKDNPDLASERSGNPPDYAALRLPDAMYVEYLDGSGVIGYYDLRTDPYELHNIAARLTPERKAALHATIQANTACKGQYECWTAQSMTP